MRLFRCSFLLTLLAISAALVAHAATPDTADAIFEQAKAQARAEHKNVLMIFSASWCGPCKLYERFLDDPQMKALTEKALVIQRIDVGERKGDRNHADTPGGEALRSLLGAAPEPGFPWIVITTPDGRPVVNSYVRGDKANNIGYPVLESEIDWYMEMMRKAAPQLNSADLAAIRSSLTLRSKSLSQKPVATLEHRSSRHVV